MSNSNFTQNCFGAAELYECLFVKFNFDKFILTFIRDLMSSDDINIESIFVNYTVVILSNM